VDPPARSRLRKLVACGEADSFTSR
jgi:hypothetical protein